MAEDSPAQDSVAPEEATRQLKEFREALTDLHKALIDSERIEYERVFGTIPSPGAFLQLLTRDSWFAWLRPLSEFIASLDEALDGHGEAPLTGRQVSDLLTKGRAIIRPSENGDGFGKEYYDALQRDPDVVMAHGKIVSMQR
jgi:hypothetical protein